MPVKQFEKRNDPQKCTKHNNSGHTMQMEDNGEGIMLLHKCGKFVVLCSLCFTFLSSFIQHLCVQHGPWLAFFGEQWDGEQI